MKQSLYRGKEAAIGFAVLLAVWACLAVLRLWPAYLFPSPLDVIKTGIEAITSGELQRHVGITLYRLIISFVVSSTAALGLAILIGMNKYTATFFDPVLNFFQSIAGIAWVPLAVIWFGFGLRTIVFVLFNTIFFFIVFNAITGIRTVPTIYTEAILTLGAKKRHIIIEVILPGALPNIVTGFRLGLGFGWRALLAAEMISTDAGLGFMIFDAHAFFKMDEVIVGMITIGALWMITDNLFLRPLERKTIERWGTIR